VDAVVMAASQLADASRRMYRGGEPDPVRAARVAWLVLFHQRAAIWCAVAGPPPDNGPTVWAVIPTAGSTSVKPVQLGRALHE
jgi:hypothetical protein